MPREPYFEPQSIVSGDKADTADQRVRLKCVPLHEMHDTMRCERSDILAHNTELPTKFGVVEARGLFQDSNGRGGPHHVGFQN